MDQRLNELLDNLEQLIENSPALPLSTKKLVDEEEFFVRVQRLKTHLSKLSLETAAESAAGSPAPAPLATPPAARPRLSEEEFYARLLCLQEAIQDLLPPQPAAPADSSAATPREKEDIFSVKPLF